MNIPLAATMLDAAVVLERVKAQDTFGTVVSKSSALADAGRQCSEVKSRFKTRLIDAMSVHGTASLVDFAVTLFGQTDVPAPKRKSAAIWVRIS